MFEKSCRSCKQEIDAGAKRCHHCGSSQNVILNKLQNASLILSILVAIVSLFGAYNSHKQAGEAESAKLVAEKAVRDINSLNTKLEKNMETVSTNIGGLDTTIANAKKDIQSLVNVTTNDGNNILDLDGKVRVQWGKFQTKRSKKTKQTPVSFPLPFADDEVSVALTIVGDPARSVEGKSIIAQNLDSKGFTPKVSDPKYIALGVEVSYVAFGKTPN